ncbi:PfkB family carbohydrate kinase [Candidatus Latescibacterota bacterium]
MGILVIGSLAFDDIETDHGCVTDAPGGSALYFTVAASLYAPVAVLGVVGDDFPAEELTFIRERGIDTDHLDITPGGKTFRWGGRYETDMNRRTTTKLEQNVFQDFAPRLDNELSRTEYVFLGNIDPDLQLDVLDQLKGAKFIGADTIECYIVDKPGRVKEVLARIDVMFLNDDEARLITGEHNIITASRDLLKLGPRCAVIKKGEHGSILAMEDGLFVVPAYPINTVVDPTGAGDSFAGAAFGYLAKKDDSSPPTMKRAVVHGGIAASFTVEDFGLKRLKQITVHDIEERLELFRAITLF